MEEREREELNIGTNSENKSERESDFGDCEKKEEGSGLRKWRRIAFDACCLESEEEKSRYEGPFHFEAVGTTLTFHQQPVKTLSTVGLTVWDASLVLAKYLEKKYSKFLEGKRVLELGAGCGIPGTVAALLGAVVTFTDAPRVIGLMRKNADANLKGKTQYPYKILELSWGKTGLKKFKPPVDVLLAADVLYQEKAVLPLLRTTHKLASEETLFLFAFEMHDEDAANMFWKKVESFFEVTKIPLKEQDEYYQDEEIQLLSLRKKVVVVQSIEEPREILKQKKELNTSF